MQIMIDILKTKIAFKLDISELVKSIIGFILALFCIALFPIIYIPFKLAKLIICFEQWNIKKLSKFTDFVEYTYNRQTKTKTL